VLIDAVSVL